MPLSVYVMPLISMDVFGSLLAGFRGERGLMGHVGSPGLPGTSGNPGIPGGRGKLCSVCLTWGSGSKILLHSPSYVN